jgi:alpha-beta hydrolase superfamily lysophospholipase
LAEAPVGYQVEAFTASDGYCIRYRHYLVKTPTEVSPRANVVCVHGIQSHAGWYSHSCTELSRAGFQVFFLDRRGSGINEAQRGDTPSFRRLLGDIYEFLRQLRPSPTPAIPVFLLGISWGGKLVAAFQRFQPGQVAGLILLCPGLFPRVRPALVERLRIAWSRLTSPTRLFPIPLNDPELFTTNAAWQRFIQEDPLSLRQATARLLVESIRLDYYVRFVPRSVNIPVLVMLAERDRIIDNVLTRRFVEKFATADKEIIEYAGAAHTLEFEPAPSRFLADLRDWLDRHTVSMTGRTAPC